MRLVCDSCHAVYTIDDGLVGARDFRVSCKACGEPIVVRKARQVAPTQRMLPPGTSLPPPSHAAIAAAPSLRMPSVPVSSAAALATGPSSASAGPTRSAPALATGPSASAGPARSAGVLATEPSAAPVRSFEALVTGSSTPSVLPGRSSATGSSRAPATALAAAESSAASVSPAAEPAREGWYVAVDGRERGPLSAQQIAGMLEQGSMDWSTQVWRHGLKGWRAARRDAQLVTAVAGVHGVAGDTTRLGAARSFISPGDTLLEPRRADATGLLRKQRPVPSEPRPLAPRLLVPGQEPLPDLRPSPPPQAWHSPENAAFRAALGLPSDSTQQRLPAAPDPVRRGSSREASTDSTQHAARAGASPRSAALAVVAVVSFTAGALSSAAWERLSGRAAAVTDVARAAPVFDREEMVLPVQAVPTRAFDRLARTEEEWEPAEAGLPELPTVEQLRTGVRGVTGDVRRCVDDPATGIDVDIYLDGPSGRVRDVDVRSPLIPPARVECIQRAVRRMQFSPFTRPELKLMHKFRW